MLGFLTGVREDYTFQADDILNADPEVGMLDNDFKDPDLDRYLEIFERYDPSVAVIGDAYSYREAVEYQDVVDQLKKECPYKTCIVVPKCRSSFEVFNDNTVLGYPIGYGDLEPEDIAPVEDWRGNDIHLLGGSPPVQTDALQRLTQPTLTGLEPANIVGADWNGPHKVAYHGERWDRDGWQRADHLSIRETVRKSLEEIKAYWLEKDLWPETELRDLNGEVVEKPKEPLFMDDGGDPIGSREELENSTVREYLEKGNVAFKTGSKADFIEYREGYKRV